MAEYIERTALLNEIAELHSKHKLPDDEEMLFTESDIRGLVMCLPTAEVEPVRQGTWEPCFEDWRKQIEGDKCSACGFEHYGCSIRAYHYCPNCGARMDGGGNDEE